MDGHFKCNFLLLLVCCSLLIIGCSKTNINEENIGKLSLLPSKDSCGYQKQTNGAQLNARTEWYPWLATISFKNNPTTCLGTLINDRYVLTSGVCVVPPDVFVSQDVRLGECKGNSTIFEIEETIYHEDYTYINNNVGLIRLSRPVNYTDCIQPICLPIGEESEPSLGDELELICTKTSEQNVTDYKIGTSVVASAEECDEKLIIFSVFPEDVCVKLRTNMSDLEVGACPMVSIKKNQFFVQGLNAYSSHMDASGVVVGPKIYGYVNWILSKIKP